MLFRTRWPTSCIAAAASKVKKVIKIEGGTHSGASRVGGAAYRDAVLDFVRRSSQKRRGDQGIAAHSPSLVSPWALFQVRDLPDLPRPHTEHDPDRLPLIRRQSAVELRQLVELSGQPVELAVNHRE